MVNIHVIDNINGESTLHYTNFTQQMLQSDVEGMTSSKRTDEPQSCKQNPETKCDTYVPHRASMCLRG